MTPQIKQRWKYTEMGNNIEYCFIAEIIAVHENGSFDVKVVSYVPQSIYHKDKIYRYQPQKHWEYLPGQDAQ